MLVNVSRRRAVPEIVGVPVSTGGADAAAVVAADGWAAVPSALVAVTSARSRSPSSATATV